MSREALAAKERTRDYRHKARAQGGVIIYAMITDPEAIKAWAELQKIFGSNRDAVEDAIITSYEQIKGGK